jgi:hypothetical protein
VISYRANGDVSANGRFVAFTTAAAVFRSDPVELSDTFVRDRRTGSVTWITRGQLQPYPEVGYGSYGVAISADGRHASFGSDIDPCPPARHPARRAIASSPGTVSPR